MSRRNRDSLDLGERLGQGGQGAVHQVRGTMINQRWAVVYKEYAPEVLPEVRLDALTAMVDLVERLPAESGEWLCEKTAWPAAVVEADGAATGFLMRAVPDPFHFELRTMAPGGLRKLAAWEFLLNTDSYVAGIGLRVSERDRLLLLADVARTLARLHAMDVTVGDLSPKNLMFSTEPGHACFLIDCDAMRLAGADVLPQVETPEWEIPAGEEKGTRHSDAYKFALLAVRTFARDQSSLDAAPLAAVDPALGGLAARGLSPVPHERPAPSEWAETLLLAAPTATTAPAEPAPAEPPGRGSGSEGLAVLLTAVVALVVIALLVAGLSGGDPSDDDDSTYSAPTTSEPVSTPSGDPSPSGTPEETESPAPSPADYDDEDTDPTPAVFDSYMPETFTDGKGVEYTQRSTGKHSCGDGAESVIRRALRAGGCRSMLVGTYVNTHAEGDSRILVTVWVAPLDDAKKARAARKKMKGATADDWGIWCPRNGPGSHPCDARGGWTGATMIGYTGSFHRYVIHTLALYTNLTEEGSAEKWVLAAAKKAWDLAGPQ